MPFPASSFDHSLQITTRARMFPGALHSVSCPCGAVLRLDEVPEFAELQVIECDGCGTDHFVSWEGPPDPLEALERYVVERVGRALDGYPPRGTK